MNSIATQFLERLFSRNKSKWWENLKSETPKKKYGPNARFLQTTLEQELTDVPEYRSGDRRLFFFSTNKASSIDGRYKSLGIEEKYNPLDLKEHLIDGAIHRGVVWVLGNPHNFTPPVVESISLYVVQADSTPISPIDGDLYFPVLFSIFKLGIHIVFIDEKTGEFWKLDDKSFKNPLPKWLASKESPAQWDRNIDEITEKNKKALNILNDPVALSKRSIYEKSLPGFGKKGEYKEVAIGNSCKAAIIDYGNQWRLIELGLLLRSAGYAAVKAIYNKEKHKNKKDQTKNLVAAGRGVEKRIAEEMLMRFAVDIDWRCNI